MMVLDTDVLIEIFDRRSAKGEEALRRIAEADVGIATTSINFHEIIYGLRKYAKLDKEVSRLPVLAYTKSEAMLGAELEATMEGMGTPVRRTDAMIAAVAMNRNASLYTFDMKHFGVMEAQGLKLVK
jgi:predicted nucleic acid-binding protein